MEDALNLRVGFAKKFYTKEEWNRAEEDALRAVKQLENKTGAGREFLGWVDLPETYDREEYARIREAAEKIAGDSDVLVVIGIGGSFLGAKAAIDFLSKAFPTGKQAEGKKLPEICFAGQTMAPDYIADLCEYLEDKDWSVNVISKSGTTTESSVAFRIFRELLEAKYGEKAAERIYATTDRKKGALKQLAEEQGYETFVIPDDIGGRFSVLSAVGLLPIAAAGIDTEELLAGAQEMRREIMEAQGAENPALQYAILRQIFYRQGKRLEILASDGPYFRSLGEWWMQLYAESEGKEHKGLFPTALEFTKDLHSVGQYIQDGERTMLETVISIREPRRERKVPEGSCDDGLDYLTGRTLSEISQNALAGTVMAHTEGGVPVISIFLDQRTPKCLGKLFYFFEYACAVSGYMLEINPFDQPGVEDYKRNMFALLGKPGYEEQGEKLKEQFLQ